MLLASLKPDSAIPRKLDAFRFSDEPAATVVKEEGQKNLAPEFPRELIKTILSKTTQSNGK